MPNDPVQAAHHAMIRFGFGRRAGEALPHDAMAWLRDQLDGPDPARFAEAPSAARGLRAEARDQANPPTADMNAQGMNGQGGARNPDRGAAQALFREETEALLEHALATEASFRERLVWFWANHFTVSLRRGPAVAVINAFVQEAIRPHVTGQFVDMLLAVMRHPGMLLYLDNTASIGPNSQFAQTVRARRQADPGAPPRGLNENLARECLELHTITPAARYSQADVTSFAQILTGWSIDLQANPPGFRFRPLWHEPGAIWTLGREFPPGEAGGRAALIYLGTHPATYRNIAGKLARHFIADDPPPAMVAALARVLEETRGDLGAATRALIARPEAWQPLAKLRQPQDFVLAALRALDLPTERRGNAMAVLRGLGQGMFNAPAPIGWPDRAEDWAAPEAMLRRVDWAFALSRRAGQTDPFAVAEASLGPLLSADTAGAMRDAGSRQEAMALLLASPEFQRR